MRLMTRRVRLDPDGAPWTSPRSRHGLREMFLTLYEKDETWRQIIAAHQELSAKLDCMIDQREEKSRRPVSARGGRRLY